MKNTILSILVSLPILISAQNDCNFFDYAVISVDKTDINTTGSDFGPAFVDNELWYSAFTAEDLENIANGKENKAFYDLFVSETDADGNLVNGKKNMLGEVSQGYHAGPVAYCKSTGELFVTLSNFENPEIKNKVWQKADIRLKIVILKKEGDAWKVTSELPFNDPSYSVGHPAISADGNVLVFSSNKPGGKGGTDLYYSVREYGSWSSPESVGDNINTSGNEMFPFIFRDQMLIFASNGHNSSTDLDMYYSCRTDNGLTNPKAIEVLNSSADDFGLVIHKNEKTGYFASQKTGGEGHDDIYKIDLEVGKFELELLVQDKETQQPIPSATVIFSDNKTLTTDASGKLKRELEYNTDYNARSAVDGYINESIDITTKGASFGVIAKVISIAKEKVVYVLENINYDFDKWDILPESEVELNKLIKIMKDNPDLIVELGSHTDERGTEKYNDKLSQKRSESAVNYIIAGGIDKSRIVAKGYGETKLINKGKNISEELHRENRRTEFKIND